MLSVAALFGNPTAWSSALEVCIFVWVLMAADVLISGPLLFTQESNMVQIVLKELYEDFHGLDGNS